MPLLLAQCDGGPRCWQDSRRKSFAGPRILGGGCWRRRAAPEAAAHRTRGRGADHDRDLGGLDVAREREMLRLFWRRPQDSALALAVRAAAGGDLFPPGSYAPHGNRFRTHKMATAMPVDRYYFPRCGRYWLRLSRRRFEPRSPLAVEKKGRRKLDSWVGRGGSNNRRIGLSVDNRLLQQLCTIVQGCVQDECRSTDNNAIACDIQLTRSENQDD